MLDLISTKNYINNSNTVLKGGSRPVHPGSRPNHPGSTSSEQAVKGYLRSKGCKCSDTTYLNITSTDSR